MNAKPVPAEPVTALADLANAADAQPNWPSASWDILRRAGVLTWSIPKAHGGEEKPATELLAAYHQLAGACLTTCFILSQREAAARRIIDHGTEALQLELLPPLARGATFSTVGLSQLTTSRQFGKPAMSVTESGDKLIFDGVMPWVTGAAHADYLVTGGVLPDGRQLLTIVHRTLPGVTVAPSLDLMALQGSLTAEVKCDHVAVERRWLLAGPADKVLATGRGGTGGLETSCLALGLANAAIQYLIQESASRPELRILAERLAEPHQQAYAEMMKLAQSGGSPEQAAALRGKANTLVLQATQTALTAAKGAGFLKDHPAQRWARQALFFLVWSCPRPATEATLAYLVPSEHEQVCL
jgi:butyryl-CoA dehydrogenase